MYKKDTSFKQKIIIRTTKLYLAELSIYDLNFFVMKENTCNSTI